MTMPAPPTAKKAGAGDWLKAHKAEAGIGAAGIVVTLALYVRSKSSSSASSATPTAASTANPAVTYPDSGYTDTGAWDGNPYGGGSGSSANATQPVAVGSLSGSGFLPPGAVLGDNPGTDTAQSSNGQTFTWLTPDQWKALGTGYVEETPGTFTQINPDQTYAPGTPFYGPGGQAGGVSTS